MTLEELEKMTNACNNGFVENNYATNSANNFANDYDWDAEWEAFNPIEACVDAYLEGIRFAIREIKKTIKI